MMDILIEDNRWQQLGLAQLAHTACTATLAELGLSDAFEISILACDDARIAVLNTEFRNKAVPTNVLSWPSEDRSAQPPGDMPVMPDAHDPMAVELGDIAIAYDTCAAEARDQGKTMYDHTTHLLVHGTLHLLGFDHINDADADLMEGFETRILAKLTIADPYKV